MARGDPAPRRGCLAGVHLKHREGLTQKEAAPPPPPASAPAPSGLTLALYASSWASSSSAESCCFELLPVPLPLPRLPPRAPLRVPPPNPPEPRFLVMPPLLTLARNRGLVHTHGKARTRPRRGQPCPRGPRAHLCAGLRCVSICDVTS